MGVLYSVIPVIPWFEDFGRDEWAFGVWETLALRILCRWCWVCVFCWFGCFHVGTAMRGILDCWSMARMVDVNLDSR